MILHMRLRVGRLLIVLFLLAVIAGLVLWRLTWTAPRWWAPPNPRNAQVAALADHVELRLIEEAQRIRPVEEPWTIRIRQEQVNAWLSAKLPQWIEHLRRDEQLEWPEQLGTPQVKFDRDGISLGLELGAPSPRIVVARMMPSMHDGKLRLSTDQVAMGRIEIPGASVEMILDQLREVAPSDFLNDESVQLAVKRLFGQELIEPVVSLADGRVVRLTGVACGEGTLDLTCQTIARESLSEMSRDQGQ